MSIAELRSKPILLPSLHFLQRHQINLPRNLTQDEN